MAIVISVDPMASATSSEEIIKTCPRCPEGQSHKPLSEFSTDRSARDGKNYICKDCVKERWKEYSSKRKRTPEEDAADENDPENTADETENKADDLYVMQNSCILNEVKIGRSTDPGKRSRILQTSQNYTMDLLAVFPGSGYLESAVHNMLAYCRVRNVPGREWFKCSFQTAFGAIGILLDENKK